MGRCFTCDAASPQAEKTKKPFIVDVPASMLKRNPNLQLNKAARNLYTTMRALANGKTGELKINGRWVKATVIDKAAEMCRDLRMRAMRDLVALGLVTMERERVKRVIKGRIRVVRSFTKYVVFRSPTTNESAAKRKQNGNTDAKNQPILLQSISSTVVEIDSQFFSETPRGGSPDFSGSAFQKEVVEENHNQSSSPRKDDDRPGDFPNVTNRNPSPTPSPFMSGDDEILVRRVQDRLRKQYPQAFDRDKHIIENPIRLLEAAFDRDKHIIENPFFVLEAIEMIDQRGSSHLSAPEAYFATGVAKILDCDVDLLAICDILARKFHLREKFMARFEELSPEQEQARRKFNAMEKTKCKSS